MTTARQIFAPIPEMGSNVASASNLTASAAADLIPAATNNQNGIIVTGIAVSIGGFRAGGGGTSSTMALVVGGVTKLLLSNRLGAGNPIASANGAMQLCYLKFPPNVAIGYDYVHGFPQGASDIYIMWDQAP